MKTEKEQNLVKLKSDATKDKASSGPLSLLRMATLRLADSQRKPKLKTRDLVGLLLCHSARAWRSSMPHVVVKLSVKMPNGMPAVRFSCPVEP